MICRICPPTRWGANPGGEVLYALSSICSSAAIAWRRYVTLCSIRNVWRLRRPALCIGVAMEKLNVSAWPPYSGIIGARAGIAAVMATMTQERTRRGVSAFRTALVNHWPEYLMEGAALGFFMLSACTFGVLLDHPMSPVQQFIEDPLVRRALFGVAMGL